MIPMKNKQNAQMATAKQNLDRIKKLLAPYEKKNREKTVEPTHGKWTTALITTVGAGIEPAPGSLPSIS